MNDFSHDPANFTNIGWKKPEIKLTPEEEDWIRNKREEERIKSEEDWEDFARHEDNDNNQMPF